MKIDLQTCFNSGIIEIEKAREFFRQYNQESLFNGFIEECVDKEIAIGRPDNTKIRFFFEDKEDVSGWLLNLFQIQKVIRKMMKS